MNDDAQEQDLAGAGASPAASAVPAQEKRPSPPRRAWNAAGRRISGVWTAAKRKAGAVWLFTKELFNDHAFWVDALAVKGGASAIVITGLVGISAVMTMPFLLAATGITLCVGLIGVGLFGMAAGGAKAWEGLCDIYARAMGRAPKEHVYKEKKDILQRLASTKMMKKLADTRLAKKIAGSRVWKTTQKFMRKGEDSVLGSIAVGGAALSLVVGALALPFVAAGALITAATVMTASTIISGLTGLYFSITGLREKSRMKRAHIAQIKKAQDALRNNAVAVPGMILPVPGEPPFAGVFGAGPQVSGAFGDSAKKPAPPANDDAPQAEKPAAPKKRDPGQ